MSAKLIDVQIIEGVYIDRNKNLSSDHYNFQ